MTTTTCNPIIEALREIVHDSAIERWLKTPNPAFGMRTPQQVIDSKSGEINSMIYRLRSGEPG
jgi:uncharacterized protein (DUF2384 family)